ncbi:hypothetical protein Tco_0149251 [Tanacetum coccineum]
MAEPKNYITATRKNFISNYNEGRMVEKCIVEIQGKFLEKIRNDAFNGNKGENTYEHINKFLDVVGPIKINGLTQDRFRLSIFPVSLIEAASRWLRNQPSGSITTWEVLKTKFLNKYCPHAPTAKKMEEIHNFQQEPDESLFCSWEIFKELTRSTETSDGLAAIQAQLNNLGREVKKVNEKVYAAQVGCELCKGPHYTQDCSQKEEGKTLEEAYYTQFGAPYQLGGQYRAARLGFYQQNNRNSSYSDWRPSLEESLTKFMAESAKRHKENSNIIKEIRASTDAAIRNQGSSIKTLEIQIGQMSKVLQERGFGRLPSSTKMNPQDQVKSISTVKADFSEIRRIGHEPYADVKILDTYDHSLPQKEKDTGSFTLPCFIHNICFDKALVDLGASVSIMPFSTYTNLGLGILSHTRDKDEGKSHASTLIDVPIFVGSFSIISGFTIIDDDDMTKDVVLGIKFCEKYTSCQRNMNRFALGINCERIIKDE